MNRKSAPDATFGASAVLRSSDSPTQEDGTKRFIQFLPARLASAVAAIALLASAPANAQTTYTWTGNGGDDNWSTNANWSSPPAYGILQFAGSNRTTNNNDSVSSEFELQFNSSSNFTLGGQAISFFDFGGQRSQIRNDGTGTGTVNLNVTFADASSGSTVSEINAINGDLIFGGTVSIAGNVDHLELYGNNHVVRFSNVISGSGRGVRLTENNTMIYAAANTYSGDTEINAGDLRFAVGGSANSSIIRLGGTGVNSAAATLSLGVGDTSSGINPASTLVVRPSASGTQGVRLLRNLNTASNTYSGNIFLDADLTMRSATSGSLNITGTTDIKNHVLTIDDNSGNVNTQGSVVISGALTSSLGAGGSLVKNGTNTLILQGTANSYTGTDSSSLNGNGTQIGGGTLGIYGDGSLGVAPAGSYNNIQFTGDATLQDTANNVSLAATRNVSVASGKTATFDGNGNTFTVNGVINGSGGNIATTGGGSLVLTNTNTFTGTTTINNGTLNAAAAGALSATSGITVNSGGTLLLSGSTGVTDRIKDTATVTLAGGTFNLGGRSEGTAGTVGTGALTLTSNSIIDLTSTSLVHFAASNNQSWTALTTLSIYDWSGTPTTGGGAEEILFGTSVTSLTPTQLAQIQFVDPAGFASGVYSAVFATGLTGEIVPGMTPVPEPSTWVAGALALLAVGYSQRRRFTLALAKSRALLPS